jgi:hypothetical protein
VAGWRLRCFLFVAALLSLVSLAAPWISILTAGEDTSRHHGHSCNDFVDRNSCDDGSGRDRPQKVWIMGGFGGASSAFWPVFATSISVACSIEDCN